MDRKKQRAEQEQVSLLNHYIALLQSALQAKEAAARATLEYHNQQQSGGGSSALEIDESKDSMSISISSSGSGSGSSSDISSEQQETLRLLRRMEAAKEDEAAARKEVEALEGKLYVLKSQLFPHF